MPYRYDPRPLHRQIGDSLTVWLYIIGLAVELFIWTMIAWPLIGSGTRVHPDYHLSNPTPASQPYNTIHEFQRPRR
ncbi:MAG: hypothetical protein ACRD01_09755 [Terriglobales bacterium]